MGREPGGSGTHTIGFWYLGLAESNLWKKEGMKGLAPPPAHLSLCYFPVPTL